MEFYPEHELKNLLGGVGERVTIHRSVVFFRPEKIVIGSDVRIDCFAVLSAGSEGIQIGNHVHIAASTHLFGSGGAIILEDFSNLSSRVSLFTASDDYKEGFLTNPTVPMAFKKVTTGSICVSKHAIIGCGAVVLPGVTLHTGAAVGALSLVKQSVDSFHIVGGVPAKMIGKRKDQCLFLEEQFLQEKSGAHTP